MPDPDLERLETDPDLERIYRNLAGPSEIRYDARVLAESIVRRTPAGVKRDLALMTLTKAVLYAEESRDEPPHSQACGVLDHGHGPDCHSNCPTCHGALLR